MLKFQIVTKEDRKLAAAIERRRQIEEARKQRIFNPRARKIGIDKDFLDKQVEEKKQLRELEQTKACQFDENLIRSSKLAMLLEKQQEEERRRINKEIESYRRLYQRPECQRDYDLNDPEALKKSLPVRTGGDDSHLGLAAAQKFEGEGCNLKELKQAKQEEMRWWIEKQKEERQQHERERMNGEKAYQEAVISRDKRATALDQMERECRRRLAETTARFNLALAGEQEHRRRCEATRDEEDKKAEIFNHVTGDFLTEAKEQAESTRGPNRPLATRYKGMTAEELKAFRDAQERQKKEIEKMKFEEKKMNEEWDQLMNSHSRVAHAYQCELDRKKADENKRIAEENLQLAQQQKFKQDYLNRVVYRNHAGPEFFAQFNRGTR